MKNCKCIFCGGETKYIYKLNGYDILQCEKCFTSFVDKMPSDAELETYYKGFKFCINEDNKKKILKDDFRKWFSSFNLPHNAKMLDIGGGGGFFSLAFQKFGFGDATYIDLDPDSCKYAESQNISNVFNSDVSDLLAKDEQKFDFIYSRHLIEHLVNPIKIIDIAIDLLSDDGVFLLQFPNGLSYERLVDKDHYQNRQNLLVASNHLFSKFRIFRILHSNKTAFGLDPIRHLWAISPKGIYEYLKTKNVDFTIKTYGIDDKIYSPYFYEKKYSAKSLFRAIFSLFNGKCHLVVQIKKKKLSNFR